MSGSLPIETEKERILREQIAGGLWGSIVGDALGVPVEFSSRSELQREPVTGMRGFGRYNQPAGTWSDDSSLLFCTVDSLCVHQFEVKDMAERFLRWYQEEIWTPHGVVFDIGVATSEAIARIASGVPPAEAGGDTPYSNGNGSLMRIIPVALRFHQEKTENLLRYVHRASAITHRHARSLMACGFHALLVRALLTGQSTKRAYEIACEEF